MPATRAAQFEPVDDADVARWSKFARAGEPNFPRSLGMVVEDVRHGYSRIRLPFRHDLLQSGGVVHGGALATLLDSVMVPAIGVTLPRGARYTTVDLHVQFLDALVDEDAVAEGWIVRRGRRTIFGESEARSAATDRVLARSLSTFAVLSSD